MIIKKRTEEVFNLFSLHAHAGRVVIITIACMQVCSGGSFRIQTTP
jgi:hypothetical protein